MSQPDIIENYRNDADLRTKYFQFTRTVFPSVGFEAWYEQGWWTKDYIPFSVVEGDRIVSNVSVSEMDILVDGKPKTGLQIGAVGTIPEFENRGLSRHLMEYVINRYELKSDLIFLFANDTVLDFYPKFGFRSVKEVIFKSYTIPQPNFSARKLDLSVETDMNLIKDCIEQRGILTRLFGADNYGYVTHWHLINIFPDNILYVEDDGAICICKEENRQLHLWDVASKEQVDINKILPKLIKNKDIKEVLYYFPPDQMQFNYDQVVEDKDSHLFVRGNFDVEGREFKFPVMAQT